MRSILFITLFVSGLVAAGCFSGATEGQNTPSLAPVATTDRVPVIVELFTSEGCSSCPPADRALKFFAEHQPVANAEIIPLAFHVDYWNYLGWKDRFSSPEFSRRQETYVRHFKLNSSYTPQMVVDGRFEFVGSDTGKAAGNISEAVSGKKAIVALTLDANSVNVSISGLPHHELATVFLAVTENGLTSDVRAGENRGQKLEHIAVVRTLSAIGSIEPAVDHIQIKFGVPQSPELNRDKGNIVVFVQEDTSRRIIAAGMKSSK